VKAKDDTAKVLGETVFKGGVEDVEELQVHHRYTTTARCINVILGAGRRSISGAAD
jgi:hypothetical protein